MYEIEKGIPVVDPTRAAGQTKYPFRDMTIGDSFFVPKIEGLSMELIEKRVRVSAAAAGRSGMRKFIVRVVEGGVRVWRTA